MGKHYVDPIDKPPLIAGMVNDYLIATCLERQCKLYVMDVPYNIVTDVPQRYVGFLSWEACVRNIRRHNEPVINKINCGNRRKARLLVYTTEECMKCMLLYIDMDYVPQAVPTKEK